MLTQKEDQFMDRLKVVLDKGNFGILHEKEVQEAKKQDYKVTLDIELAEDQYDMALLNRFFKRYGKAMIQRANLTDYMLIFHRGVGVDRDTQLFVNEKLELILDRIKTVFKEQVIDRVYVCRSCLLFALEITCVMWVVCMLQKPKPKSDEDLKKEIKAAAAAADPKTGAMVLAAVVVLVGIVHETMSRLEFAFPTIAMVMLLELGVFFAVVAKYFVPPKGSSAKDLERERVLLHRAELRAQNPLPDLDPDEVYAKIERIRLSQLGLLPHGMSPLAHPPPPPLTPRVYAHIHPSSQIWCSRTRYRSRPSSRRSVYTGLRAHALLSSSTTRTSRGRMSKCCFRTRTLL